MLRPATPADLPYIAGLLNHADNLDRLGAYEPAEISAALTDPDCDISVWDTDRVLHGFIWLRGITRDTVKIEEFACSTPGAGIGKHLFQAATTRVAKPLWLYVAEDNAGAIRFYDRQGFTKAGTGPELWHRRVGAPVRALKMVGPAGNALR